MNRVDVVYIQFKTTPKNKLSRTKDEASQVVPRQTQLLGQTPPAHARMLGNEIAGEDDVIIGDHPVPVAQRCLHGHMRSWVEYRTQAGRSPTACPSNTLADNPSKSAQPQQSCLARIHPSEMEGAKRLRLFSVTPLLLTSTHPSSYSGSARERKYTIDKKIQFLNTHRCRRKSF